MNTIRKMMDRAKGSQMKLELVMLGCFLLLAPLVFTGCGSLFGANAVGPTKMEQALFTTNEIPVTKIVTVNEYRTNVVPITVQREVVSYVTNSVGVPQYLTNTTVIQAFQTNVVPYVSLQTNVVLVPQLAPSGTTSAIQGGAGLIGNLFGVGGLVTTALGGLLAGYLKLRNNALAGQADTQTQVSAALTQNIQTMLEVLQGTPQGQALLPKVKQYLKDHQTDVGVLEDVGNIIETYVNNDAAKGAANSILGAVNTLMSGGASASPTPNAPSAPART